jgi:transcriptional regulator with XRE-family HTH domain
MMRRFDASALHAALDAKRKAKRLTWQQVASAIGVSAATITRTRNGGRMEVDGMLAMVDWLKRPVEDFVRPAEPKRGLRR